MSDSTVVLITGASSGIGRACARNLVDQGYVVYGTSRSPQDVDSVAGVEMLPLDVTQPNSPRRCVEIVLEREDRVDVLINNAGMVIHGSLEETRMEEVKTHFETNFFGAVRMINAVLPAMRQRCRGRIVNMSSVAGRIGVPFMGFYAASKFALEGYSQSLREELKPFGIKVVLIEPGFIRTPIGEHAMRPGEPLPAYDSQRERAWEAYESFLETAPEPGAVARTLARILDDPNPGFRYPVGSSAHLALALQSWLPDRVLRWGIRRAFNLNS